MEVETQKNSLSNRLGVYITINDLPIYSLVNELEDDKTMLISSFLYAIDTIATNAKENTSNSSEFHVFSFINDVEVNVIEILTENEQGNNYNGRIFIEIPYGKKLCNNRPIAALLGTTREIISKIVDKTLNPHVRPKDTAEHFENLLRDRGYTPDNLINELGCIQISREHTLAGFVPISLPVIKEKKGEMDKEKEIDVQEIGTYYDGRYMNNPIKNEKGDLTFDLGLLADMISALKTYQSSANSQKGAILLRFKDYVFEASYKKDSTPIVGVLVKGKRNPQEVLIYRKDILEFEASN